MFLVYLLVIPVLHIKEGKGGYFVLFEFRKLFLKSIHAICTNESIV